MCAIFRYFHHSLALPPPLVFLGPRPRIFFGISPVAKPVSCTHRRSSGTGKVKGPQILSSRTRANGTSATHAALSPALHARSSSVVPPRTLSPQQAQGSALPGSSHQQALRQTPNGSRTVSSKVTSHIPPGRQGTTLRASSHPTPASHSNAIQPQPSPSHVQSTPVQEPPPTTSWAAQSNPTGVELSASRFWCHDCREGGPRLSFESNHLGSKKHLWHSVAKKKLFEEYPGIAGPPPANVKLSHERAIWCLVCERDVGPDGSADLSKWKLHISGKEHRTMMQVKRNHKH